MITHRKIMILIQLENFDFKNRTFECTSARKRMKQINFENGSSHGLLTPYCMKRYCIFEEKLLWDYTGQQSRLESNKTNLDLTLKPRIRHLL